MKVFPSHACVHCRGCGKHLFFVMEARRVMQAIPPEQNGILVKCECGEDNSVTRNEVAEEEVVKTSTGKKVTVIPVRPPSGMLN